MAQENVALSTGIAKLDGQGYVDDNGEYLGEVYFAAETRRYYAVSMRDVENLGERILAGEQDAYSLWCAESDPEGEGATEDEALEAAGWVGVAAHED